jgi:hypothetical protein
MGSMAGAQNVRGRRSARRPRLITALLHHLDREHVAVQLGKGGVQHHDAAREVQ